MPGSLVILPKFIQHWGLARLTHSRKLNFNGFVSEIKTAQHSLAVGAKLGLDGGHVDHELDDAAAAAGG